MSDPYSHDSGTAELRWRVIRLHGRTRRRAALPLRGPATEAGARASSSRLDDDEDDDRREEEHRALVEDAEPALAARVGELLELAQERAAGVVVADRDDDERDLGVQPMASRPLADPVAEPEDEAERDRDHHQQAG